MNTKQCLNKQQLSYADRFIITTDKLSKFNITTAQYGPEEKFYD